MKRKIITIMLIIISVAMCKIESHAVVGTYSDYEEGKVNYDEIGEASFGYCDTNFYNEVYFEKSIRDDEIGKISGIGEKRLDEIMKVIEGFVNS